MEFRSRFVARKGMKGKRKKEMAFVER